MVGLDTRRSGGSILFLTVVIGQIILISAQVTSKTGRPMLESVTFGIFAEMQRGGATVVRAVTSVWQGYFDLRGVRAENETLRRELADAKVRLQQERALAQRSQGLQQLLDLRGSAGVETAAAEVIAAAATPDFRTVTIDKGTAEGLRPDMAVIAAAGVVGRIVVPSARAAKVQLLIDRNAAAGALVERSRAQGVVVGMGDNRLRLDFLSGTADLKEGDVIVTSGIDGIYPKGFLIGRIERIERSAGSYKLVTVRPAVDFTSLEDVLVVLTPPVSEAAAVETRR
jgi:rod shape-determining protein MreC